MDSVPAQQFYVQKPIGAYGYVEGPSWVIKAKKFKGALHLIEPNPKYWGKKILTLSKWEECEGPARALTRRQYLKLYETLHPNEPLSKGTSFGFHKPRKKIIK